MSTPLVLAHRDVSYLDRRLLNEKGHLRVVDAAVYDGVKHEDLLYWCNRRAFYGLPTTELIGWLRQRIGGRKAIEIGSGNGVFGRALGIPATDSCLQADPAVATWYALQGQPVISYGDNVERLEALDAVEKHRPQVVVASWVTEWIDPNLPLPPSGGSIYGVKEWEILKQVETYILIGNTTIHGGKRIVREHPPEVLRAPWLWSRSSVPKLNCVMLWDRR